MFLPQDLAVVTEASGSLEGKLLLPLTPIAQRKGEREDDKLELQRHTIGRRWRLSSPQRGLNHLLKSTTVTVGVDGRALVVGLEFGLEEC